MFTSKMRSLRKNMLWSCIMQIFIGRTLFVFEKHHSSNSETKRALLTIQIERTAMELKLWQQQMKKAEGMTSDQPLWVVNVFPALLFLPQPCL